MVLYKASVNIPIYIYVEILIILAYIYLKKTHKLKKITESFKKSKFFLDKSAVVFIIIFSSIMIVMSIEVIFENIYVANLWIKKEYKIVNGEVENFEAGTSNGRYSEKFSIGNVYFEYSTGDNRIGYEKVRAKGGVITGNNQKLLIYYVYIPFGLSKGNRIIYIEQI